MSRTSPTILFGDNALAIKADATFSCTDVQPFVDLTDLNGEAAQNKWITYEPDTWQLDGSYHFMPAAPQVGLMSASMSDASGNMSTVTLQILFTQDFSITSGMTLYFSQATGDWADNIEIEYVDSGNTTIRLDGYTPTSAELFTNQPVSNFRKIFIYIYGTNKAYRFARLLGIDFDTVTRFTSAEIKAAMLHERVNPLSVELPFNEVTATLYSADGDFSIVDPQGVYATFYQHQPLDVYELLDGAQEYMGRFYLETWDSETENLATIRAVDAIGLLDGLKYFGFFASGTASAWEVGNIVDDILGDNGVAYELDASLSSVNLYGLLLPTNAREALQQVLFAIGAYVTCARSNVIQIKPFELASDLSSYDYTITSAQKGILSPVNTRPFVSGVKVAIHDYTWKPYTEDELTAGEKFNQTLAAGTHRVLFNPPLRELGITGATITDDSLNVYADVVVAAPGIVVITAIFELGETTRDAYVYDAGITENLNVIEIRDASLVTELTATAVTQSATTVQRVYDYYQQRFIQKTKLFGHPVAAGDSVLIATQGGRQIGGILEKQNINLIGFVSEAEVVGVVVPV